MLVILTVLTKLSGPLLVLREVTHADGGLDLTQSLEEVTMRDRRDEELVTVLDFHPSEREGSRVTRRAGRDVIVEDDGGIVLGWC